MQGEMAKEQQAVWAEVTPDRRLTLSATCIAACSVSKLLPADMTCATSVAIINVHTLGVRMHEVRQHPSTV